MKVTLYRATDDPDSFGSGACFAADQEDAETYQDNPGYGGEHLLAVDFDVDADEVLSLVRGRRNGVPYGRENPAAWDTLAELLDVDVLRLRDENPQIENVLDTRKHREALRALGYEWVVYEDSYPEGAVTWVYLGTMQRLS